MDEFHFTQLPWDLQCKIMADCPLTTRLGRALNRAFHQAMLPWKIENDLPLPPTNQELVTYLETFPPTFVVSSMHNDKSSKMPHRSTFSFRNVDRCHIFRSTLLGYLVVEVITCYHHVNEIRLENCDEISTYKCQGSETLIPSLESSPSEIAYDLLTVYFVIDQRLKMMGVTNRKDLPTQYVKKYLDFIKLKEKVQIPRIFLYLWQNARLIGIRAVEECKYCSTISRNTINVLTSDILDRLEEMSNKLYAEIVERLDRLENY